MLDSDTRAHAAAWVLVAVLIAAMAGVFWLFALLGGWQHV